jgi:hypothetical protein
MAGNFFLRPAAAGAAGGYNAITAAKLFWGASAILGNTTYTPDTSKIGNGTTAYEYSDIRQPFNPAGILLEAKVHEQGPGLIVRGEAQVEIYSASGLSSVGASLGGSFSISFWGGFQIYDMSITNIQPQGWQVTVKGMARGRSGPYNFVDLGATSAFKGQTLGMSLKTWLQNELGTLTEENVGKAEPLATIDARTAEGLFVEGNSLADYCESLILDKLPGTTITEFFGFNMDGITGPTAAAAYNQYGVPGVKAQGQVKGVGTGIVAYRTFAAPN